MFTEKVNGNKYRLSCALVTRNRPESLRRTLVSLFKQTPPPFEVIVSDDSDTQFVAANMSAVQEYGYKYVRGPHKGLYANRNFAFLQCSGDHFRSMDDDHEFPEGHLSACYAAIERDPHCIWFIGESYPDETGLTPTFCPGQLNISGVSETPKDPDDCWAIADGASIYPRSVFESGHFFSEEFKFGASYLEFGSYIRYQGYRMRFLPETFIIHHYDPANRSFNELDMELSSRAFAMLCHSFLYRPSWRSKAWTSAKTLQYLTMMKRPLSSAKSIYKAIRWRLKSIPRLKNEPFQPGAKRLPTLHGDP